MIVTDQQTSDLDMAAAIMEDASSDRILRCIGQLTRTLRDSMRELGLDKQVEAAAQAVPDARDRLKYVATMTEQAAERAQRHRNGRSRFRKRCSAKRSRWRLAGRNVTARRCRKAKDALLAETRTFLQSVPERTQATHAQLMEIMLAQGFQDLTGQVIKKITDVVYLIEQQLLGVLLENIAPERREQFAASTAMLISATSSLERPAERAAGQSGRQERCRAGQSQVDNLLASLGF